MQEIRKVEAWKPRNSYWGINDLTINRVKHTCNINICNNVFVYGSKNCLANVTTTSFNQMYILENYQIFYLSFGKLLQQICPQDTFWNNNNLISTQNTIEEKE